MSIETPAETRDQIILAALPSVVFDGWTFKALEQGAADLGLPAGAAARAFPRGLISSVEWFSQLADRLLIDDMEALAAREGDAFGLRPVHEKIAIAVRLRLDRWSPHKEAVRRAMGLYALPASFGLGPQAAWRTADVLWRAAGDQSNDFNWYTKRATLVAVWSATVLFWLDDRSANQYATWDFLDRQLANVGALMKARKKAVERLKAVPNPFKLLKGPTAHKLRRTGGR